MCDLVCAPSRSDSVRLTDLWYEIEALDGFFDFGRVIGLVFFQQV